MTHITTEIDEYPLIRLANNSGMQCVTVVGGRALHDPENFIVFLNGEFFKSTCTYFILTIFNTGNIIGVVHNYRRMIKVFRLMRRAGYISSYVSIYPSHLHRCIYISSDGGRLCRPYIIVENGVPLVTDRHITELEKGIRTFEDFLHDGQ